MSEARKYRLNRVAVNERGAQGVRLAYGEGARSSRRLFGSALPIRRRALHRRGKLVPHLTAAASARIR